MRTSHVLRSISGSHHQKQEIVLGKPASEYALPGKQAFANFQSAGTGYLRYSHPILANFAIEHKQSFTAVSPTSYQVTVAGDLRPWSSVPTVAVATVAKEAGEAIGKVHLVVTRILDPSLRLLLLEVRKPIILGPWGHTWVPPAILWFLKPLIGLTGLLA
mgnify:CR=1 FL=1